jgi:hypothetical protein
VTGDLRQRPVLTPTGHAPVHETRVQLPTDIRSEAQALHDARTVAFDQSVTGRNDFKRPGAVVFLFQVQDHSALAARQQTILARRHVLGQLARSWACHHGDLRPQLHEQQAGQWPRSNALEFHDADPLQRRSKR